MTLQHVFGNILQCGNDPLLQFAGRGGEHRRVLSHIPRAKDHTVSGQVIVVAISAELKQRITAALENVTKDMLQCVWHEFDY